MRIRILLAWAVAAMTAPAFAANDNSLLPLQLITPPMDPVLTVEPSPGLLPAIAEPAEKYQLTWMRTNNSVKPYQVMDDLTFVGIPVFLAGIIAKSEKKAFRQNDGSRHVLLTKFRTHIDDYSQYFGPVATVGLKVAGVEGRSDWGRLLASSLFSYGIMAGFVNGIKYTAKEMRPDGSTANSWPSGHTATSFVGATILHKEYGMTRSPWFSIAGYGAATATGVMRVLNNRHWVSDVLSGAGIGIMSTELGYALGDIIFKGRGLLRGSISGQRSIIDHPSFFSISMGLGFGSHNLDFDMNHFDFDTDGDPRFNLKLAASTSVAAEGAYFLNKYVGVGGRLRVNSAPVKGWDGIEYYAWESLINDLMMFREDPAFNMLMNHTQGEPGTVDYMPPLFDDVQFHIESNHLTEFAADLGLYFNLPLSSRFALGSKLLVGRSIMQAIDLDAVATGGIKEFVYDTDGEPVSVRHLGNYETEWDFFTVEGNNTMKFGTGLSLTYAYKDNFAWKIFLDYDFARKTYTMTYNPDEYLVDALNVRDYIALGEFKEYHQIKKNRNTFILGGSFAVSF